jgi:hypothetical protein
MGVVYRAEDLRLSRHAALKFLPADTTTHDALTVDRLSEGAHRLGTQPSEYLHHLRDRRA